MKVFLGDLVHNGGGVGTWYMPLNVGYIAAYARKQLPESVEIRIFKWADRLIDAIRKERPQVVALSHYVWNANLNQRIYEVCKEVDANILTVGGGPNMTSLNADQRGAETLFARQRDCDVYVLNAGEKGFAMLVEQLMACGGSVHDLKGQSIPGAFVNGSRSLEAVNGIAITADVGNVTELDDIPSPYLTGLLDEFFEEPIIPLLETNRSCPYRCTFCAWGISTPKLTKFSNERVIAEIEYIAARCKHTTGLRIADANFAILERDAVLARRLREARDEFGFPNHVMLNWNKTRPDRVAEVMKAFGGIAELGASMQTTDDAVLGAIKRKNLTFEQVSQIRSELSGGDAQRLGSELILGLPEETYESHIRSNRQVIDAGALPYNYNLFLLPGTDQDAPDSRAQYVTKTAWRLSDNAFGNYAGKTVIEGEEVVIATPTMSEDELRSFRLFHFFIHFMWVRKTYFDYLQHLKLHGIHPVDVALELAERFRDGGGWMGDFHTDFRADHDLELFDSLDELGAYWSEPEHYARLEKGTYGKINYLFGARIVLERAAEFDVLLYDVAQSLWEARPEEDAGAAAAREAFLAGCAEILRFAEELRVRFATDGAVDAGRVADFALDVVEWRDGGYKGSLGSQRNGDRFRYQFYLSDDHRSMLSKQIAQYDSSNLNKTLRMMAIDTDVDQFFYRVRKVAPDAHACPA